ncbi:Dipeptide-binding protein [Pluralibacter gergoviae]|nr:Dipeptide-binding protein [Pluralibacter gergoviae]
MWSFSFDRQKNDKNPYHKVSGGSYEYFEGMGLPDLISEVKKVDDNTVQFVLTRPESPFLRRSGNGLRLHSVQRVRR